MPPATILTNSPTASLTSALISSGRVPSRASAAEIAVLRLRLKTTVPAALPDRPMMSD